MVRKIISRYDLRDIPEFQRFQAANPDKANIGPLQAIMTYGRAIHWVSIFDIIWPNFDIVDKFINIEVAYIVNGDPDDDVLSVTFFTFVANMIAMFWELQLEQNYPAWEWRIIIEDDPEVTVELEIFSKE